MLAEAYSKSMTMSCLWVFCGRRRGDGTEPSVGFSGMRRRMLPYCVCVFVLAYDKETRDVRHASLWAKTSLRLTPSSP